MYKFKEKLQIGRIISRPNRFIMHVAFNGQEITCHCPSTGKIGCIPLDNLPCLISKSDTKNRKTNYTVEAISINNAKSWIGINQNAVNRYIEYFFKNGLLSEIAPHGERILSEQKFGKSKLDFRIDDIFTKVKMPLIDLFTITSHTKPKECQTNSFDRFVKHMNDLKNSLHLHCKAAMLICFMFDTPFFDFLNLRNVTKL